MHLACYCCGWLNLDSGSVAMAKFVLLTTLLHRGHQVGLFGEQESVDLIEPKSCPEYSYVGLPPQLVTRRPGRIASEVQVPSGIMNVATRPIFHRKLRRAVQAAHAQEPFDALIFLRMEAGIKVPGLSTIEWPQSYGKAEAFPAKARFNHRSARQEAIPALLQPVFDRCLREQGQAGGTRPDDLWNGLGTGLYCSRRRCQRCRTAVPLRRGGVHGTPAAEGAPAIVHLGGCDPRKRLDLQVDAFRLVRRQIFDASILVVGRGSKVPRVLRCIDAPDLAGHVCYLPTSRVGKSSA